MLHLHASISDKNYQVFGGHLFSATISVVGEINVRIEKSAEFTRKMHAEAKVPLLCFKDGVAGK